MQVERSQIVQKIRARAEKAREELEDAADRVSLLQDPPFSDPVHKSFRRAVRAFERAANLNEVATEASGLELNWFWEGNEKLSLIAGTLSGEDLRIINYIRTAPITSPEDLELPSEVLESRLEAFKNGKRLPYLEAQKLSFIYTGYLMERDATEGHFKPLPWNNGKLIDHYNRLVEYES